MLQEAAPRGAPYQGKLRVLLSLLLGFGFAVFLRLPSTRSTEEAVTALSAIPFTKSTQPSRALQPVQSQKALQRQFTQPPARMQSLMQAHPATLPNNLDRFKKEITTGGMPFPTLKKNALRKILPGAHRVAASADTGKQKRILVLGASGTLGRQIAKLLLDSGYQVRCVLRAPSKCGFLNDWGAQLVQGNLLKPESYADALTDVDAVIDASTSRPDDLSGIQANVYDTDWKGKVSLYRMCEGLGVKRVVFVSLLAADKYKNVPLMGAKYAIERFLEQSSLDYTILQGVAFMQGIIDEVARPTLEGTTVFNSGSTSGIPYMNTQDMAKFAVAALERDETIRKSFPLVGPKSWNTDQLVKLCERLSGKTAQVSQFPTFLVNAGQNVLGFFGATANIAERLAFAEVMSGGTSLDAPMENTYAAFGLDPKEATTMESYIKDYYDVIIKRLSEMADSDRSRASKKGPQF